MDLKDPRRLKTVREAHRQIDALRQHYANHDRLYLITPRRNGDYVLLRRNHLQMAEVLCVDSVWRVPQNGVEPYDA